MNNSMNAVTFPEWRRHLIFFSMIVMLAGLLFSRIMLSSGLALFIVLTLVHGNIASQLRIFFSSPLLWSVTILFLVPLITGLWSEDLEKWSQIIRIKIPLIILPVCFAALGGLDVKFWERLALAFIVIIFAGACVSMWHYMQDAKAIHAGYLKAQTIITPAGNDHVRFSLLVAIAIFALVYLLTQNKSFSNGIKWMAGIIAAALIIYLHVLAVRTGLLCLYAGILIFCLTVSVRQKPRTVTLLLLLILIGLPVLSYYIFPTFKNRISYLRYDLSFAEKDIYLQGSNDGTRIISMKAGWQLLQQHPLQGTGFGDIAKETKLWYGQHYPAMIESDKILPSSDWLMYGAGAGWGGLILFAIVMLFPFFVRDLKKNIAWWILNISLAMSYLFDIGLEVQYGVFTHVFVLLWWYQWLKNKYFR